MQDIFNVAACAHSSMSAYLQSFIPVLAEVINLALQVRWEGQVLPLLISLRCAAARMLGGSCTGLIE